MKYGLYSEESGVQPLLHETYEQAELQAARASRQGTDFVIVKISPAKKEGKKK